MSDEAITEKQKDCDHRFVDGDRDSPSDWCAKCHVLLWRWQRYVKALDRA